MSNNHFLTLAKTSHVNDEHTWSYNVAGSGQTHQICLPKASFQSQVEHVMEEVLTRTQADTDDDVIVIENQLNDVLRHMLNEMYPNLVFVKTPSVSAKEALSQTFNPSFTKSSKTKMVIDKNEQAQYVATDASGGDDQPNSYWGWSTDSDAELEYNAGRSVLSNSIHVELESILRAGIASQNSEKETIIIQSDSTTSIKALSLALRQNRIPKNIDEPELVNLMHSFTETLGRKNIQIQYVPAHSNYLPNERIDTLLTHMKKYDLEKCEDDRKRIHALALLMSGFFYDVTQQHVQLAVKKFTPVTMFSSTINGSMQTFMEINSKK